MVASSRSSVRRPNLRGDHNTSRPNSPITDGTANAHLRESSRPKRTRIASASEREQVQKRRRVSTNADVDEISIPLRGRDITASTIPPAPPNLTRSILIPGSGIPRNEHTSQDDSPLQSPTPRPQYDQIRRIEEKARAAIHKDGHGQASKEDRRRLRSEHGSTRSKTELAQYFPAFEEMLSLDPPNPDAIVASTRLILVNDTPNFQAPTGHADPFKQNKPLHDVTYIDLAEMMSASQDFVTNDDPLSPDLYFRAHRKAERHEKQMKNGDKERAQHEKYQLERLLDELRGPDWLKTLGITGITDTEKKRYEPKRLLFIRETRALIEKFKRWKEEEKRRKLEKEQAALEEAAEVEDTTEKPIVSNTRRRNRKQANETVTSRSPSIATSAKGPDSSEMIDALASQQLLLEAKSASARRKRAMGLVVPVVTPELHKPFVSFFSKRHIRDAAVAGRQRGRTVLAFGEPVIEPLESEFELPSYILTDDAIRASQRNRRRVKRGVDD